MNDVQIFIWFCVVCAVITVASRVVSAAERNAVEEQVRVASLANRIAVRDSRGLEGKSEELMTMMAGALGARREKLTPDARFQEDLRVPPGELEAFLNELRERYEISIDSKQIRKVGDILGLLRVEHE